MALMTLKTIGFKKKTFFKFACLFFFVCLYRRLVNYRSHLTFFVEIGYRSAKSNVLKTISMY